MMDYCEIIDSYTHYKNGSHHYVSIPLLDFIINKLKECKDIPNKLSINPFFEHKDFLIEIDERMLFIESRKNVNEFDIKAFYEDLIFEDPNYFPYNQDIEKRCFLIQKDDIVGFKKALDGVILYLNKLIPYILQIIKNEHNLTETELLYGNICFEIYCE